MKKIINFRQATKIFQILKKKNKKTIICGGCFDILHIGHIEFLEIAKKQGGFLFVLLENDKNVKKIKGKERPINSQN